MRRRKTKGAPRPPPSHRRTSTNYAIAEIHSGLRDRIYDIRGFRRQAQAADSTTCCFSGLDQPLIARGYRDGAAATESTLGARTQKNADKLANPINIAGGMSFGSL